MVLDFFFYKGPCRGCQKEIWWLRRTCPACSMTYPGCRPFFYWLGAVIFVLGLICVPIAILGLLGII